MIRAAFFDIDGTLLSHAKGKISAKTLEALYRLHDQGVAIVLASGRAITEMDTLGLELFPFDAFITLNGQLCIGADGSPIFEQPIEGEALDELVAAFNKADYPIFLVDRYGYFINRADDVVSETLKPTGIRTPAERKFDGQPIFMAGAYVDAEQEADLTAQLPHLATTRWHGQGIDLLVPGGSKATGIAAYLKARGLTPDEAIAFGDGENDIAMIEYCGTGVAMGNAEDIVKEAADFVTKSVDEDGIPYALEQLGVLA